MHFNPFSTFCARRIAWELASNESLGAVVLEMFDDRWERMPEPYIASPARRGDAGLWRLSARGVQRLPGKRFIRRALPCARSWTTRCKL